MTDARKHTSLPRASLRYMELISRKPSHRLHSLKPYIYVLLALATLEDWDIESLNIKTTYLYGGLDKEIYMEQPEGYFKKGQEMGVCCLLKSLYGLKQSALQWNKELHKSLLTLGFTHTQSDASVYYTLDKTNITIVTVAL